MPTQWGIFSVFICLVYEAFFGLPLSMSMFLKFPGPFGIFSVFTSLLVCLLLCFHILDKNKYKRRRRKKFKCFLLLQHTLSFLMSIVYTIIKLNHFLLQLQSLYFSRHQSINSGSIIINLLWVLLLSSCLLVTIKSMPNFVAQYFCL